MVAPYNALAIKLEAAMKSLVDALSLAGVNVQTGIDDTELEAPYVILSAFEGGEEVFPDSGIDRLTATIRVASKADSETLEQHRARVGAVFDAFRTDSIAADLSAAAPDFHCYEAVKSSEESAVENRKFISTLALDCAVCGSDVA